MGEFQPNLDGVINDPGGNTGGGSESPAEVANLALLPVTGGLLGNAALLLMMGQNNTNGLFQSYLVDPTDFNCEEDVEYDYRVEEIEPGNEPTVHNVLIRYRDLGAVTFTVAVLSATQPIVDTTPGTGNAAVLTVGNANPTNKIFTVKANIKVTTEAPQIVVFRQADKGPLCIIQTKPLMSYGDSDVI